MIKREFENVSDFLDYAAGPSSAWDSARASRLYFGSKYNATPDYPTVEKLAREGWPEGLENVSSLSRRLSGIVASKIKKQDFIYDVAGDSVDVGRFVEGCPENMIQFTETEDRGHGRLLTMKVSATTSSTISTDIIIRRGAAAAALVDSLESVGYRVEIVLVNTLARHTISVVLKRHEESLELDRIAFFLAHPDVQRRIIFSVEERESGEIRQAFGFHARAGYAAGGIVDLPFADRGDIYLSKVYDMEGDKFSSDENTLTWLGGELARHGIELDP